jgi:hypothetical protein
MAIVAAEQKDADQRLVIGSALRQGVHHTEATEARGGRERSDPKEVSS